jgi:hypothetical protein
MTMHRLATALVLGLCACGPSGKPAVAPPPVEVEPGVEVAIYSAGTTEADARSQGFAMVVDRRRIELPHGVGEIAFQGVPETIDPGTVWFRSFTDPQGTKVLEQSFEHDGANLGELIREQVGKEIVLVRSDGELRGVLAHVDARGYVLDVGDGQQVTVPVDRALLGIRLPAGVDLSLEPTLMWKLDVARGGEHLVEVVYSAQRVSWWASYAATVDARNPDAVTVDLTAWATVANDSNFRIEDAGIKLVAGESGAALGALAKTAAETTASAWVWPVEQTVTLEARSTRQLQLFPPRDGVAARIELRYEGMPPNMRSGLRTDQYYGNTYQQRVDTFLVIANDDQLPAGGVQVYMRRDDIEEPALVARSFVSATKPEDEASIALGPASGVSGTRRQLGFNYDYAKKQINEAFEVKLQNQSDEPVRVVVTEDLYRADGGTQVVNASPKPVVFDGKKVTFALDVPAHGSAIASYEAIYKAVSDTTMR